ncbi:MAG TPA: hypothetical protein VL069_10915 [Opitutus sp.]|nr:hypothetical protein [Opitutus sp.]
MKSRVLIALLTIAVFGAGYFGRVLVERHRCPVPPPPTLLGEMSPAKTVSATTSPEHPHDAAKLAAEIERLRPEIEAFRARMEQIDDETDREVVALLRPDQLPLWEKMLNRRIEYREKEEAGITGDQLLTASQIASLRQRPLYKLLAVVIVPQKLDWLASDLNLDDEQKEKAREILLKRREKFLALVDSSPPPSLTLSRLAPMAQRLGEPKK